MWLVALLVACTGAEAPATAPADGRAPAPATEPVVATVGEHGFVTESDFADAAARHRLTGADPTLDERKEILDDLVTEEALFQQAFEEGLYRDPKVRKLMVNLLVRERIIPQLKGVDVTDEEARAYFEAHAADFRLAEKAQVRKIFLAYGDGVRSEDEAMALAREVRAKLVADPSKFHDLATQYSEDPFKRRGGDMGYVDNVPDSPYPPELLQTVFSIEPGRLSEPFLAGGGVNLVLVDARRPAVERTFEQMKGTVLRRMRTERQNEATKKFTEELLAKTEVTVDEERLASVRVDARLGGPEDPVEPGVDPDEERVDRHHENRPEVHKPRPPRVRP